MKSTARVISGESEGSWQIRVGNSPVEDRSPGAVDYAAAVHERDAEHAPPTGYKFVSRPLLEHTEELAQRVADKLDQLVQE